MAGKDWTYQEKVMVEMLWTEGKTGGQIARIMGKTRCAVMGYAHRHLPRKKKPDPHPRVTERMTGQV